MAFSKVSVSSCQAPRSLAQQLCLASRAESRTMSSIFSYSNLVHAVAGAVGSVVSMVVFYPLETARTRLQIDEKRRAKHSPEVILDIVRDEGFMSLYRGVFPVVTSLCCSNFVYFYTYSGLKAVFLTDGVKLDPMNNLALGFVAGIINVLLTTPLWVVNTRLKVQGAKFETQQYQEERKLQYKGIIDAFMKIARYEGISALWNGTKPSLMLATNPSIHFMVYETLKRFFQTYLQQKDLSGVLYFIIGAIAKTIATVTTYPIQVIQTRMRNRYWTRPPVSSNTDSVYNKQLIRYCHTEIHTVAGYNKDMKSQSIFQALQGVISNHGASGLYKGMEAKLLQTVLTAALMFMVYEKIAASIFHLMGAEFASASKT